MQSVVRQLSAWQRREWGYRAVWGVARLAALVVGVLTAACLTDWVIDRYTDTPFALRLLLSAGQVVLYAAAAYWLLYRLRVPSLDDLAGRAERRYPEFGHRLVTALQLNRPGAQLGGTSPALLAAVTREAEELSAGRDLAALADRSRLGWAAAVAAPVLLPAAGLALLFPATVAALLARQCLLPVSIPRSVEVANRTPALWPSGDEVVLRFAVAGPVADDAVGTATVYPEGQPAESFPLTLAGRDADGTAVFTAKLPPGSVPFVFRGRVGDGRTREYGRVDFAPRPVVTDLAAWVQLPAYVDPEGKRRYERVQPQGEVYGYPDSGVRVQAGVSKPVKAAELVLITRAADGSEQESARLPMALSADGQTAAVRFELPPRPVAYRVEVTDENGFGALNPPRRGITLAPDDPPRVELLTEVLKDPKEDGPLDDFEVSGMPLALGGQVQIGYRARSPLGLSRAVIVYRVNDGPWTPLPLKTTVADSAKLGPFLPELGVFRESGPYGQVEFYPLPAADPDGDPPGLEAGGRFNFQTAALKKADGDGKEAKLEVGDRVEFFVAVYDRNPAPSEPPQPPDLPPDTPDPGPNRPAPPPRSALRSPGRSESRLKAVVTETLLQSWLDQRDQSRERLKQLEDRQRSIFGRSRQP